MAQALVSLPARRPDRHADPVPVRRQGLQRAVAQFGTDVPGVAQPRRPHGARDLSGTAPRDREAELPAGPVGAVLGLVRQVPEAVGRSMLRPYIIPPARGAGWDCSCVPPWRPVSLPLAPRRR